MRINDLLGVRVQVDKHSQNELSRRDGVPLRTYRVRGAAASLAAGRTGARDWRLATEGGECSPALQRWSVSQKTYRRRGAEVSAKTHRRARVPYLSERE